MDPVVRSGAVDLVALTRALVDIDSTTGREGEAARWLADYLRGRGFAVAEQPVDDTRFNVIATPQARPQLVVLSTHFDCVPPFFPEPRRGRSPLRPRLVRREGHSGGAGRGGRSAAARWRNARRPAVRRRRRARQRRRARANEAAAGGCRFLIDGEPTDNRLGLATRGILRLKLRATGRAAHSSFPGARRVGDRQADRRAGRAAVRSSCRTIRCSAARITPSASSPAASRRTSCRRRPKPR